jgi:YebC/PmpR family DNA-binding regulatory protein
MSGHSKWSTIKHKKALEDSKRGAVFTKVAKKIQIAAKQGGSGDPDKNPTLRAILEEARSVNMPNDNVRRAIEKALGGGEGSNIEEIIYEGYGPGGVGLMITTATDNRNRTGSEIKSLLEKSGGSLAGPGSVSYLKNISPLPTITLTGEDTQRMNDLMMKLDDQDDVVDVWTNLEEVEDE